jgi:hypothetical protein
MDESTPEIAAPDPGTVVSSERTPTLDGPDALVRRLARRLHARLLETHISWVLLAPALAFKLKKPIRLPFVDYSTLERRRHFCEEEVRLNRRFAPSLYLGVSRITGTPGEPEVDGAGPVLDHAVRMRRFPAGALFSEKLEDGTLTEAAVDRLALRLAQWQDSAPRAGQDPDAEPDGHQAVLLAALDGAQPLLGAAAAARLRAWIVEECAALAPLWRRRRSEGRVRECHGDLHLANAVDLGEEVVAFDCVEFEPALRRIDVLEDAAFPMMDFIARGRADLGWRFFNRWLEQTGDHDALPALRLAIVARALVRAQVEQLRAAGSEAAQRYARTALAWSCRSRPHLVITHGLPGSGKSFAAQRLLQQQGAICLRSDVERKRLFGLRPLQASRASGIDAYTQDATRRTYERLMTLARAALRAGYPVVVDAAFLRFEERQQALAVARELDVPFSIVACKAPLPVLRERLQARRGDPSEADAGVLERLRLTAEPLRPEECAFLAPGPRAAAGGQP